MVAGSIANAIADLIDDPSSMLNTLGTALPAISVLFINYGLNVVFIQIPADMLRTPVMLLFLFYKGVMKEEKLTRRQLVEGPLEDEPMAYGVVLPKILYLLVLVITYWSIAPFLSCILAFAFYGQYLRFKYKLLFVNVAKYESGGFFWYGLYKYTMYALVASNVTMIAYFGIKEGPTQAALLLPLLYVILKVWAYTESCYKDMSMFVAYSSAVEADCNKYASPEAAEQLKKSFREDYYKQPYFSAPQVVHLQPYRIDGTPLFTYSGNLDPVYYKEVHQEGTTGVTISSNLMAGSSSSASVGYRPPDVSAIRSPLLDTSEDSIGLTFAGVSTKIEEENL